MSLHDEWKNKLQNDTNKQEYTEFVQRYYSFEQAAYQKILEGYPMELSGSAGELAHKLGFNGEMTIFMGFLDGVNESIANPLDLDSITEDSNIVLVIDYEKLYWNMHEAKADWLYNLKEWDNAIDPDKRNEIAKQYRVSKTLHSEKVGRNDPCPCGSGKKHKNCCLK